jgi:hypothetical protein
MPVAAGHVYERRNGRRVQPNGTHDLFGAALERMRPERVAPVFARARGGVEWRSDPVRSAAIHSLTQNVGKA